jgi:D-hexose-6-phosphate mutarotase
MLTSRIRNSNADAKSFTFTFAYHTYFSISDIRYFQLTIKEWRLKLSYNRSRILGPHSQVWLSGCPKYVYNCPSVNCPVSVFSLTAPLL